MCRWKILVVYTVLWQYLTAQPIADINSDRSTRQLDFGECCPCDKNDDTIEGYDGLYDVVGADTESVYPRPRDFDNCPCRNADSQGASSVLFPNTLRSAGNFLRSDDKKENLKPIFNPEVYLAASVLETLREVTDEEYQDALERDAAKSAVQEDFSFGDATPEESANILAVVVQPKFAASHEDIIPEVLHSQKSRCIHPIDSLTSIGEMPVLSQPSFKLASRPLKMRHFLTNRNFDDADNGVDASNVYQQIVPANVDAKKLDSSYLEIVTTEPNLSSISSTDEYCSVGNFPSLRPARIRNILKNLTRPNLLQNIRENTHKLSKTPTFKSKNLLRQKSENDNADLNPAASENEVVETQAPYFGNKYDRLNTKENTGPLSLKNLRKLKDVELIPLKELLGKQAKGANNKKPKLLLPSVLRRRLPKFDSVENDNNFHYNSDPNLVNSNTNCLNERFIGEENIKDSIEQKSSSHTLETATNDLLGKKPNDKPVINLGDEWIGFENDAQEDSLTGASNNLNEIIEKPTSFVNNIEQHLKNAESVPSLIFDKKELSEHSTDVFNTNSKINLFKPISIDKALSSIRENFDRNIENLKNVRTSMQNKNIGDIIKVPILGNIKQVEECENNNNVFDPEQQTDEIHEVITTSKFILPNDSLVGNEILQSHTHGNNLPHVHKYDLGTGVTVNDLENLSNSLLHQKEKTLESVNIDQKRIEEVKDDIHSDMTLDHSNHRQFERVVEPADIDSFIEDNTCDTVLPSRSDRLDDHFDVTTASTSITYTEDDNVDLQPTSVDLNYLPTVNPSPAFDEMKENFDKLLYKVASDTDMMSSELLDNAKDKNVGDTNALETNDLLEALEVDTNNKVTNAGETFINCMPQNYESDSISNKEQPQLGFLKESLPNINDIFNAVPQKTLLDDIKMKINNLFDNSEIKTNEKINSDITLIDTIENSEKYDDFSGKHVEEEKFESEVITPHSPLFNTFDVDFEARDMENNDKADNKYNGGPNIQSEFHPQAGNVKESYELLKIPTLDDIKSKVSNVINNNDHDIYPSEKVVSDEQNITDYRNSNNDDCKSPKSSKTDESDSDAGASETFLKIVPKNEENLGFKPILPPRNFINKLNSFPLESLRGDVKVKESNLLDKNDKIKEINPLDSSVPKLKSDLVNPLMATDASTSNFQTRIPSSSFLDNSNLWEFNPLKSVQKSNLLKELKFKPINDKFLGISLRSENQRTVNEKSKVRNNPNSPSVLRFPLDMKHSLDNPGEIFTSPRVSPKRKQTFDSLFRNIEKPYIDYTLQQIPRNNLKPSKHQLASSSNILDRIAKNHEDFNDKIRNLHTDFNDRIQSVRKDILDRSKSPIKVKPPITNDLFRSSNKPKERLNFIKPASKERELSIFTSSLKSKAPKPIKRISLPKLDSKKFKMPTAASNLVPKTVQVPELKPTSKQPTYLPLWKESASSLWNTDLTDLKQHPESKLQTSNLKDLKKHLNFKKKPTVTVSFSSTPLPSLSIEDDYPFKAHNKHFPNTLSASKIGDTIRNAAPLTISNGETNSVSSWPRASDTSFLSKVKDAVQTKLSMAGPTNLKTSKIMVNDTKTLKTTDLSQAASDYKDVNDMALKENVSYRCKMVCTRD